MSFVLYFVIVICLNISTSESIQYIDNQLWRIKTFNNNSLRKVIKTIFETDFGGLIWKETTKFLDVSLDKNYAESADNLLKKFNLLREIVIDDIQKVIDSQNRSIMVDDIGRNNYEMNWGNYQNVKTIINFLYAMELQFPERVKVFEIGKTSEGRVLRVLRISDDPENYDKIWIDSGMHAREWIGPAAVTYVIYKILHNWDLLPYHMRTITWYFLPLMNPDGYDYSWKSDRLWHKNRKIHKRMQCFGVDLNRNYNVNWYSNHQSSIRCNINYAGDEPFSEAETQSVRDFLIKRRFKLRSYLTFQSYGQSIKYPWGYKRTYVKNEKRLKDVARNMAVKIKLMNNNTYEVFHAYQPKLVSGTSADWCKSYLKIRYSYIIELRDNGEHGFLLPETFIKSTGDEAMVIVKTMSKAIFIDELNGNI